MPETEGEQTWAGVGEHVEGEGEGKRMVQPSQAGQKVAKGSMHDLENDVHSVLEIDVFSV